MIEPALRVWKEYVRINTIQVKNLSCHCTSLIRCKK